LARCALARRAADALRHAGLALERRGGPGLSLFALVASALALIAAPPALPGWPVLIAPPNFKPASREVDNWRREATLALDLSPDSTFSMAMDDDPRGVTRCVRLNNYWCIKRAGWSGEIASDSEGHVAFASAREGAAVAALLLRRYYVDFGLHSARAIVSRWAPAQCGLGARGGGGSRGPRIASLSLGGGGLARKGVGNTLRARWLASHTVAGWSKAASPTPSRPAAGGAKPAKVARAAPALRRSAVPDLVGPLLATPTIMAGPGAPSREPMRLAMLPYPGMAMGPTPGAGARSSLLSLPPIMSCSSDGLRIANYAAKTAAGVAASSDADLGLFDQDGRPTDNLAKVMANMASVEIGPLRASDEVVAAGVAAVRARSAAKGE
jgi:hypothetical protein